MAANGNNGKGTELVAVWDFTEEHIELCLHAIAMHSGNTRAAERFLEDQGLSIGHSTLYQWQTRKHRDRYLAIKDEVQPEVRSRMADLMESLFRDQAELEGKLVKVLDEKAGGLNGHEASTALRNVGAAKALNVEKSAPIRNEPTQIVRHKNIDDLKRSLAAKGLVIDGNATEIDDEEPAELPPAA